MLSNQQLLIHCIMFFDGKQCVFNNFLFFSTLFLGTANGNKEYDIKGKKQSFFPNSTHGDFICIVISSLSREF